MEDSGILENLQKSILPGREEALEVLQRIKTVLQEEPNIIALEGPVNIIGDLHGQFYDFLHILEITDATHSFLFLGDYVDRGYNSVELFFFVLLLKLQRPKHVVLLRGNHENRAQTAAYGFMTECTAKYDEYVYWKVCEVFTLLPLAAVVDRTYFCVHGGIAPGLTAEALSGADRVAEHPVLGSVMWGDPSEDVQEFVPSPRGAGFLFGAAAVSAFLESVGCRVLVRSHQLVFDGVKEHFGGSCITVWSAPNYCYKCKNLAAVLIVKDGVHEYLYFGPVKEQFRPGAYLPSCFSRPGD